MAKRVFNNQKDGKKTKQKKIEKLAKKYGLSVEEHTDHIKELWDNGISDEENLTVIEDYCKRCGGLLANLPTQADAKAQEKALKEKFIESEMEKIQERRRHNILSINTEATDLDFYYSIPRALIKTLLTLKKTNAKKEYIKCLILESSAGLGKTTVSKRELARLDLKIDEDFAVIQGHISPRKLYQKMYKFRVGILVFDDVYTLLGDKTNLSMFLGALWGDGEVIWEGKEFDDGTPSSFFFDGKVMLLLNHLPTEIKQFISRCFHYKFNFDYKQKIEMMYIMAKDMGIPITIVKWIQENTSNTEGTVWEDNTIDFRLLSKVYQIYEEFPDKWKLIAKASLFGENDYLRILAEIIEQGGSRKEQEVKWLARTGRQRADFYRKLKKFDLLDEDIPIGETNGEGG